MGGRLPERDPRERVVEDLVQFARALHQEQAQRAAAAYPASPPVYRMDSDEETAPLGGGVGPPSPPPPGMGEILRSHDQMRAQVSHMFDYVQDTRNRAMQLERQLLASEHAREMEKHERRMAAARMYEQALYGPQAAAPPFLNQVIGQAAVPQAVPQAAPPVNLAMTAPAPAAKRTASEPPPERPKRQIVERVVERLIERPADFTKPGIPEPPPPAPITYEPPVAIQKVMPYTHASDPALAKAVAHVVATIAKAPKRGADPELDEETRANDQSGSQPIPAKKLRETPTESKTPKSARAKTRYTTMSKFNAYQILKRREQKRRAIEERRGEREAVRVAKEEAVKVIRSLMTKGAKGKTPARSPTRTPGARLTPGRRAVVAV